MGHKPALNFSSRRASAFQRPWTAPGSSEAVRARKHPRNRRVAQPSGDQVALDGSRVVERRPRSKCLGSRPDSGARIESGARWPTGDNPARAGRGGNTKNQVPRGRGCQVEPLAAPESNLAAGGRSR